MSSLVACAGPVRAGVQDADHLPHFAVGVWLAYPVDARDLDRGQHRAAERRRQVAHWSEANMPRGFALWAAGGPSNDYPDKTAKYCSRIFTNGTRPATDSAQIWSQVWVCASTEDAVGKVESLASGANDAWAYAHSESRAFGWSATLATGGRVCKSATDPSGSRRAVRCKGGGPVREAGYVGVREDWAHRLGHPRPRCSVDDSAFARGTIRHPETRVRRTRLRVVDLTRAQPGPQRKGLRRSRVQRRVAASAAPPLPQIGRFAVPERSKCSWPDRRSDQG